MGINLFLHSVRLVLSDWRNALRISGILYLIYAVVGLAVALLFPVPSQPEQLAAASGGVALTGIISGLVYLVIFLWLAVAWHRYILLDEMPTGIVPEFNGSRMLSYFGYSLLIGVVVLVIAIAMGILTGMVGMVIGQLAIIVPLIFYVLMLIASYRLSPMLPAAAVGKPMKINEAWEATAGANGAIVVLAIVSVIAAIVINLPAIGLAYLGGFFAFIGLLWSLVAGWITMVVGVSLLTTIYGHYVEGRPLSTG